jgi:hypothetical protein
MQLWTDYEGVTIDGAFPLHKLLLSEGRSAFFSTAGPKGEPTVVRLIECHFDEEEILARWRCVEALSHPSFLKFEHYGQTGLDGRPVVYAVFEKVDANLAGVLDHGHLTVKDVAQLASSLVAALNVLHTHGFIHEHIEPRNIFAVSGVVKLRSDCIREAPEGEEGRAAKQRDVHDLATVLLQALTQRRLVEGIPDSAMPPPFGQIIRNGLDGTWELENIRAALGGDFGSKQPSAPKSVNAAPATPRVAEQKTPSAAAKPNRNSGFARETIRKDTWGEEQSFSLRSRWLGAAGIVTILLLLSIWVAEHAWNAHRQKSTQTAQAVPQQAAHSAAQSPKQISTSPAPKPAAADLPHMGLPASAGSRVDWRVVPFTYNRRTDAEKKVSSLARSHPELQPVVFAPSGHAPYLVSIGGVMDRDAAYALARRSRSLGLPHDTYAQNYSH